MSFKKTLVLALLLLFFLLYINKVEIPNYEMFLKKDLAFKDLDSKSIEKLEIKKGEEVISMINPTQADAKDWQLSEPKGAKLEPAVISSLIASLKDLKLNDALPKEDTDKDLKVYGLTNPEMQITIKNKDSERQILLGKNNEYLNKRYLKFADGDAVYMISDALYSAASKSKAEFRDKSPVDFVDTDVKEIYIIRPNDQVVLTRTKNATLPWSISQPLTISANTESAAEFTRSLRNIKVKDYIDDTNDKTAYGLDRPELTIKLSFNDESKKPEEELYFSKTNTGTEKYYFYQKDSPSILELSSNPFVMLNKKADDFREKRLFSFASDMVKSAEVQYEDGSKISLIKEVGGWKVNQKAGDNIFIDQWLSNLSEVMAVSFPAANADLGFEKPKFKLSLELEGATPGARNSRSFVVGNETKIDDAGKVFFAMADDQKNPFIINEETYKKISLREEALLPQAGSAATPTVPVITGEQ